MKKKIFSIILAVVLVASMMTVAMVSASAKVVDGRYVPADPDSTYRYYFYMPKDWENSFTQPTIGGVYWFGGREACSAVDGSNPDAPAWPGYVAQYEGEYEYGSVYYVDCPDDVATIIWNNFVNGGTHADGVYETSKEQFEAAKQTIDISGLDDAELYANPDLYPDGLEDFGNMIYVINYTNVSVNELSGKETYGGEWYYYYGEGKYGVQPTLEEAEAAGEVFDTEYQPPIDHDATPDVPAPEPAPQDPTDAPVSPTTKYFDACSASCKTLAEGLSSIGVDPSAENIKAIAKANGISDYTGTAAQDEELLNLLKQGKLINPLGEQTAETKPTAGSPSGNATSSTNDTAKKTTDNGTVQTGDASMAFIILFSVAAAAGVAIFARKKIFD